MRSEQEVSRAIDLYADTVKRICVLYLKNSADTEDIFQEVFLKYALSSVMFENDEHEKAWIIRVTINQCKDFIKSFFRSKSVPLDSAAPIPYDENFDDGEILNAVLSLPQKYRNVIYLFYYEGYTAPEIAEMLGRKTNTVYTLLSRAKEKLSKELGGVEIG